MTAIQIKNAKICSFQQQNGHNSEILEPEVRTNEINVENFLLKRKWYHKLSSWCLMEISNDWLQAIENCVKTTNLSLLEFCIALTIPTHALFLKTASFDLLRMPLEKKKSWLYASLLEECGLRRHTPTYFPTVVIDSSLTFNYTHRTVL